MTIEVREPIPADEAAWRRMWTGYVEFYEEPEHAVRGESLWKQLLDPDDAFQCRLAVAAGEMAGFVNFFEHPDTWFEKPVCYLADLFVEPSVRRGGVGRTLIEEVERVSKERGCQHVYWHTQDHNDTARSLYDDITGGTSGFIMYELPRAVGP
ncbi:MAG: GNAT family N-acetyltransferase [Acidimicrobiales bacterium]